MVRKEENKGNLGKRLAKREVLEAGPSTSRRCKGCGKTGHNIRTCQEVEEASSDEDCITCKFSYVVVVLFALGVALEGGGGPRDYMVRVYIMHVIV